MLLRLVNVFEASIQLRLHPLAMDDVVEEERGQGHTTLKLVEN